MMEHLLKTKILGHVKCEMEWNKLEKQI